MTASSCFVGKTVIPSLLLCALVAIPAQAAQVWDLKSDWSDTTNPNGAWSYNSGDTPLPRIGAIALPGWSTPSPQGAWSACPSCRGVWFLASTLPASIDWQVGDVVVHTQDQSAQAANVTWKSPIAGVIDITGSVWMDDFYAARGNQWNLYVQGVLVSTGQLSGSDPYSRATPFSLLAGSGGSSPLTNVNVATGDIVKLEIVRTTFDGFFVGTNLAISAVSVVPEPATFGMLLLGLAAVALRAQGRKPRTVAS